MLKICYLYSYCVLLTPQKTFALLNVVFLVKHAKDEVYAADMANTVLFLRWIKQAYSVCSASELLCSESWMINTGHREV